MTLAEKLNNTAIKYRKELMLIPLLGMQNVLQYMTLRTGIQWKEIVGEIASGAQLRPHDGEINEQAGADTSARELETFVGDVIVYENPEAVRKSIMGDALLGNNKNLAKHPMEKLIIAAILKSVSSGLGGAVWKAARNVADIKNSKTVDLFNGLDTITAAEILAGNITTGKKNFEQFGSVISDATIVDDLMGFYLDGASPELQEQNTKLNIPRWMYNMYNRGYQNDFGHAAFNKEYKKVFLEGTDNKCELVPYVGKSGSDLIQLTTKKNMLVGVDQVSDAEYVKVREVENPFKLQFVMKMNFGTEFQSIANQNLLVGKFHADQPL